MKFYLIPPNQNLNLMHYGDNVYFALAHHYLFDKDYRDFFLEIRKNNSEAFITLDNGAAEHSLVTEKDLLHAVEELKPNEVIAPDVLFNLNQTIANLYSFTDKMKYKGYLNHTNIFGCPQGSTKEEWTECYIKMLTNPYVSTIGLSKIAVPKCWNNASEDKQIALSRNECVQHLKDKNWLKKPLHLLGMGEHTEYQYYVDNKISCIRSSDSCYTVLAAIHNISFETGNTERIPTTNDYFDVLLTAEQEKLAIKNIEYLKLKYKTI